MIDSSRHRSRQPSSELLVFASQFPPMGGGGVIRIYNFVRNLADLGWGVTVITPDPTEMIARNRMARDVYLAEELDRRGVRVLRTPPPADPRALPRVPVPSSGPLRTPMRIVRRLVAEASALRDVDAIDPLHGWRELAVASALQLRAQGYAPAAILSTSPPHSVQYTAMLAAQAFGVPLIADFRDQWVGNPHPMIAGDSSVRAWANRRQEEAVIRQAAMVLTTTEESANEFANRYSSDLLERICVIPNGFDGAAWEGIDDQSDPDHLIVSYVGTLYPPRDVRALAEGLQTALGREPSLRGVLRLRIVGQCEDAYARALRDVLGDSFEATGPVSQLDSLHEMANATWLLAILHGGEGASSAVPGKLLEYLAAKRPVLGLVSPGAAANFIERMHLGMVVDPTDSDTIAHALLEMFADWKSGSPRFAAQLPGRDLVASYDRRVQAAELERVLRRVG